LLGLIEKAADLKLRVDEQGCPFPSILNLNTLGHWFPLSELSPSRYFRRHPLNLRHVVVMNGLLTAVIPFDGYARPILFSDGALIGSIVLPANTVADVKLSGLFAGHFHH
jgi:hypothetical protein